MAEPYEAPPEIKALIGKQIVVDTDSSYVYIGLLEAAGAEYFTMSSVDVHDTTDSKSTKEHYAHESRKLGARENRKMTYVRLARVVSVSKLEDILVF